MTRLGRLQLEGTSERGIYNTAFVISSLRDRMR
jgi:hypothetical protein